ncbi:transposase, MuDR, MULE transposase domain protein [Tanacetum coccineum]
MKSATWLVRGVNEYQYQVLDGQYIREVNLQTSTCECRKWQLSGLPCGHVIAVTRFLGLTDCVQYVSDWFKKPKYQGTYLESIHFLGNMQQWEFPHNIQKAIPPRMDNPQPHCPKNTNRIKSQGEELRDFEDMVSYLKWRIPRRFTTLYYMLPPNYMLSSMKQIKNDYHTNVMYDIAKVARKLQMFVSHTPIDLSMVLIPNNGSLEESFAGVIFEETKIKLEESLSYLHQKRKNKKFDYYELLGELSFINKTKPATPYTQTVFNFVVHNKGQLVLDDTNNTMYVNGRTLNINILRLKLEDLTQYLFNILGTKIHALYYKLPHNGLSLTVKLRNNYDMHVMFDISSVNYKLEIYVDHIGVNFVISNYIFPNASMAEMINHVITDYSSENEDIIRKVTQNDYNFDQMVEWAKQEQFEDEETKLSCPKIDLTSVLIPNNGSLEESFGEAIDEEAILEQQMLALMHRFADRFTDHKVEINNLMVLHDHPLVDYGKYALGCMTWTDMKKCVHLKSVRDELLRSMEEKCQLMTIYRDM